MKLIFPQENDVLIDYHDKFIIKSICPETQRIFCRDISTGLDWSWLTSSFLKKISKDTKFVKKSI